MIAQQTVRTWGVTLGGIACIVYAFVPPTNPVWVGLAGTVWGLEPMIRARSQSPPAAVTETPA